jgi:hypothetical protein
VNPPEQLSLKCTESCAYTYDQPERRQRIKARETGQRKEKVRMSSVVKELVTNDLLTKRASLTLGATTKIKIYNARCSYQV